MGYLGLFVFCVVTAYFYVVFKEKMSHSKTGQIGIFVATVAYMLVVAGPFTALLYHMWLAVLLVALGIIVGVVAGSARVH